MRKPVALILLVIMVSVQTPLGQLFKFPLLVEHYLKHQQRQGRGLIEFLEEHYASDHRDADFPEDQQLPFKNISFSNIGYAVVSPAVQSVPAPVAAVEKKILFHPVDAPQQYISGIFHPPRV